MLSSINAIGLEIPNELKNKTITLVSHSNAGGQNDIIARSIAKKVEEQTGLNIVVLNKPGASGNIGVRFVKDSVPNGLTLCHCDTQPMILNAVVKMDNSAQPGDLVPIIILREGPFAIVVPYTSKISNVRELVAESKVRELNFATIGQLTTFFAAHVMSFSESSKPLNIIPYKGDPENIIAVSQNAVDFTFVGLSTALMFEKLGKVKIIAIGGHTRLPYLSQYPVIKETHDMTTMSFSGIFGPKNMSESTKLYLNTVFQTAARDKEFTEFLKGRGSHLIGGSLEQANEYYVNEFKRTSELFEKLKLPR